MHTGQPLAAQRGIHASAVPPPAELAWASPPGQWARRAVLGYAVAPTAPRRAVSRLGLCPHGKKTGGRVKSSRTRRGVNRAAQALRLSAQSLHHSQGALGGFLRRMKGRLGAQAAVTATAHKLARIVSLALKHGMTYVRQSQEEYEAQMKEKQIKALKRKARQLGLEIIEKTSGVAPTAAAAAVQG